MEGDSGFSGSDDEEEYEDSEISEESEYSDSEVEPDYLSDEGLSWGEMERTMANEDRELMKRNEEEGRNNIPMQKKKQRR